MDMLIDCIAQNKIHPNTFEIPSQDLVAKLKAGDAAKVFFQYDAFYPCHKNVGINSERLWVDITQIVDGKFTGTIANDPVNPNLKFGQILSFEAKHICNLEFIQ